MKVEEILEEMQNRIQALENQKAMLTAAQQEIRQQMAWIKMMEERKYESTI